MATAAQARATDRPSSLHWARSGSPSSRPTTRLRSSPPGPWWRVRSAQHLVADPRKISWMGADATGTGIDRYQVQRQKDGGAWTGLATTASTHVTRALRLGHAYRFRVRPRDLAGNWGDWATSIRVVPKVGATSFLWWTARHGRGVGRRISARSRRSATAPRSTCPARRGCVLVPGHTPGARPCTSPPRHDARLRAATPWHVRRHCRPPRRARASRRSQRDAERARGGPASRAAGRARWVLPGHGDAFDGGIDEAVRLARRRGCRRRPEDRAAHGGGTVDPMPAPRRYVTDAIVLSRSTLARPTARRR